MLTLAQGQNSLPVHAVDFGLSPGNFNYYSIILFLLFTLKILFLLFILKILYIYIYLIYLLYRLIIIYISYIYLWIEFYDYFRIL